MAETITAQAQQASQVKSAFLFNFAKFVEWPPGTFRSDQAAIILGFSDRDPMAEALEALQGKTSKVGDWRSGATGDPKI